MSLQFIDCLEQLELSSMLNDYPEALVFPLLRASKLCRMALEQPQNQVEDFGGTNAN